MPYVTRTCAWGGLSKLNVCVMESSSNKLCTVQPRLSEHLMSQAHPDGRNIRITITLHGIAWTLNAHARVGVSYEYH